MMRTTEFIYGRNAKTKTEYIFEKLQGTLKNGRKAVVIVPETMTQTWEILCASRLDQILSENVEVVGFNGLATSVFRMFGGISKKYLTNSEKNLLMWNTIVSAKDKLKVFNDSDRKDRYTPVFLETISEMKNFSITPEMLEAASERVEDDENLANKLHDLAFIYSSYSSMLGDVYRDIDDIPDALIEKLRTNNYFGNTDVFVDSFVTLNPKRISILEQIFRQANDVYMTFPIPHKEERDFRSAGDEYIYNYIKEVRAAADRAMRENPSYHECPDNRNTEMRMLSEGIWDYSRVKYSDETDKISIIKCNDKYDEAKLAAVKIKELVNKGANLSDIFIVVPDADSMNGITDTELENAGIPVYSAKRKVLSGEPVFRFIQSALRIITYGWKKEDFIALSKTGLCGISSDECDAFEEYVDIWNINYKKMFCMDSWEMKPSGITTDSLSSRDEETLLLANNVRKTIVPKILDFEEAFRGTVKDMCTAIFNLLCDFNIYEQLRNQALNLIDLNLLAESQEISQVWKKICELLDMICKIMGDARMDKKEVSAMLRKCAETYTIGTTPDGIEKVTLDSVDKLRFDGFKHIILLGCSMGNFPKIPKDRGFFSDEDKIKLEGFDICLDDKTDKLTSEALFLFGYAAGAAEETLTIFIPLASDGICRPSVGVNAIENLFPSHKKYDFTGLGGIEAIRKGIGDKYDCNLPLSADDEHISKELADELFAKGLNMSPSSIDKFADCEFSYFMNYQLRINDGSDASVQSNIIGTFVHAILENFMREATEGKKFPMTKEEVNAICQKHIDEYTSKAFPDAISDRSKFFFERVTRSIRAYAQSLNDEFSQSKFTSFDYELGIGKSDDAPSLQVDLKNGSKMRTNGIVDRVDIMNDEENNTVYVRVVDYKTGSKEFSLNKVKEGHQIQMLLYLFSLCNLPECTVKQRMAPHGEKLLPAGVIYFSARPGSSDLKETSSLIGHSGFDATVDSIKRTGVVLKDIDVLCGMDKDLTGKYAPITTDKAGKIKPKNTVTLNKENGDAEENSFEGIKEIVEGKLKDIGNALIDGEAKSEPNNDPCRYCKYKPICRHENKYARFEENEGGESDE